MILVSRIRAIFENTTYSAAYDLAEDLNAELPSNGVVLSGGEAAQIREALRNWLVVAGALGIAHTDSKVVDLEAALSLLDSAGSRPLREEAARLREELMRCGLLAVSERQDGCIGKTAAERIREIAHRNCWPEGEET